MTAILSLLLLFANYAPAQDLPPTSWKLNPQLKLKAKPKAPRSSSPAGFNAVFAQGDLEIHSKGTRFDEENIARQMSAVEFTNLARLYEARGNPYEGQITEIVECDKTYKPRSFQFELAGQKVKGLLVGANERRLFGACVKSQIAYWVSYFNFYDPQSKMVIEHRVYLRAKQPDAAAVEELSKKLEKITKELLVVRTKP